MTSVEESWTSWLCEMEQDDYNLINQPAINIDDGSNFPAHHDDIASMLLEENTQRSFSTESHCASYNTFNAENTTSTVSNSSVAEISLVWPSKSPKICTSNSTNTKNISKLKPASSPCSYILSFENNVNPQPMTVESVLKPKTKDVHHGKSLPTSKNDPKSVMIQERQKSGSATRSPHHAADHIIAERMRREKISQQFVALSALIPGLKKMDKASVLADAIKYVKQMKEQVKLLEEQRKRKGVESVVFVKKSHLSGNENVSDYSSNSCSGNSDDPSRTRLSLPEVEARVSEKRVLIRIHCDKRKAMLVNIIREIEKLHLSVINSSALIFGSSVLHITIIAEMEDQFSMNVKELAENLRVGLLQFM